MTPAPEPPPPRLRYRLLLEALPPREDAPWGLAPPEVRLRRLVKAAGRYYGLTCLDVTLEPKEP